MLLDLGSRSAHNIPDVLSQPLAGQDYPPPPLSSTLTFMKLMQLHTASALLAAYNPTTLVLFLAPHICLSHLSWRLLVFLDPSLRLYIYAARQASPQSQRSHTSYDWILDFEKAMENYPTHHQKFRQGGKIWASRETRVHLFIQSVNHSFIHSSIKLLLLLIPSTGGLAPNKS